MGENLFNFFINMVLVSALSFGGGAQALFYDFGVVQTQLISGTDLAAILAFGYATPGPAVFGTATFIGYRLNGLAGALVGTIGIFVVPWAGALLAAKYLSTWLNHPHAVFFVKGAGLAGAGVVASTAVNLMSSGITSNIMLASIAIGAFLAIARWKINPLYVLVVGGVLGALIS